MVAVDWENLIVCDPPPLPSPCLYLDFFWNHSPINAMGLAFKCTFKLQLITCVRYLFLIVPTHTLGPSYHDCFLFFAFKDQIELGEGHERYYWKVKVFISVIPYCIFIAENERYLLISHNRYTCITEKILTIDILKSVN